MQVEFQNNKADFIDFHKSVLKKKLKDLTIILLVFFAIAIACCSSYHAGVEVYLAVIVLYILGVAAFLYFIPLYRSTLSINKLIQNEPGAFDKRIYTITEEGLKSEGVDKNFTRYWESLTSINSFDKYVYIILVDKKVVVIPKSAFATDADAANFIGLVRSKIKKPIRKTGSKPTFKQPDYDKSAGKPPYLLGLLGVVPLVGAFVGVALILYGIFKYKDKWLVLIGTAGILFTFAIYGTLTYMATNSDAFHIGLEKVDSIELTSLVKDIEFYKTEHGQYPDSLQQLDKHSMVSIDDPILNGEKNDLFNYHLVGKKYTLFSSGFDKKPYTSDDIYPSMEIDTNKIGLVIDEK